MRSYFYIEDYDRTLTALMNWITIIPGLVGTFSPLVDPANYQAWWYIPSRIGSLLLLALGLWIYWSIFKSAKQDKKRYNNSNS